MIQFSVYARLCNGTDMAEIHRERLRNNVPNNGSIRVLTITEKQYENVEILLGKKTEYEKPVLYENISFF